jgi:hypothetical protein
LGYSIYSGRKIAKHKYAFGTLLSGELSHWVEDIVNIIIIVMKYANLLLTSVILLYKFKGFNMFLSFSNFNTSQGCYDTS